MKKGEQREVEAKKKFSWENGTRKFLHLLYNAMLPQYRNIHGSDFIWADYSV